MLKGRKNMKNDKKMNRRDFLGVLTAAISGIIGLAIGIPAVSYILGPALKEDEDQTWIPVALASKVEIGIPTLFKINIQQKAGWIANDLEFSFYIFTENGRDFVAMSNVCTHLGCRVRWVDSQEQFFCPCHNAIFDKNGLVVTGPPPEPLTRYEVKEEDGQLFILGGLS
jgi:menaquinol-cytochrome c reductase iron-sulfur subunit